MDARRFHIKSDSIEHAMYWNVRMQNLRSLIQTNGQVRPSRSYYVQSSQAVISAGAAVQLPPPVWDRFVKHILALYLNLDSFIIHQLATF